MHCHGHEADEHHQCAFCIGFLIVIVLFNIGRMVLVRVAVNAHVVESFAGRKRAAVYPKAILASTICYSPHAASKLATHRFRDFDR